MKKTFARRTRGWGRALLAAVLVTVAACTVTGPPDGGTPYGLEERSHGHP
jgi:hypothetical protein